MRTLRGLFPRLCDPDHLDRAATSATRGKRRRRDVALFLFQREAMLADLSAALADGSYRPSGFQLLLLREPKPRIIARAPVADRVVHAALIAAMEPALTRSLVSNTFACRPGFGTHRAVLRVQREMQHHRFCVHLDIRAYFASVDLEILRALLRLRVWDTRFLNTVDHVLEAGAGLYDGATVRAFARYPEDWPPRGGGLPIGALTSQVFAAHLYLDGLDQFIQRDLKVPGYVRYVDDLFLFGDRRAELRSWSAEVGQWLGEHRHLRLKHPDAPLLACAGHLDALGSRVCRTGRTPLPRSGRRLQARVRDALGQRETRDLRRSFAATAGVWWLRG